MKWLKKNADWLLSAALVLVTVTVFGPLELYSTNVAEFWFGFDVVLQICGLLALLGGAVMLVLGLILRLKVRRFYGVLLFAGALALYIQGNFANINYGTLDGTAINWDAYITYGVLDTIGWLALVAGAVILAVKKPNWMRKIQIWGSAGLMAMMALSLGVILFTADVADQEKPEHFLSTEGIYQVSENENVIVFVLDSFDAAYYQAVYEADPEKYSEIFRDFTYFDNAIVAASRTTAAMPALLTGEAYPGKVTYYEYIREAFDSDGLYTQLKEQGYDTRIYTESMYVPEGVSHLVDNQSSTGYEVTSLKALTRKYFQLTLYKYAPHILKEAFWMYSGELNNYKTGSDAQPYIIDDAKFFANMQLQLSDSQNAFRLYHLHGPHSPYTLDENAQPAEQSDVLTQTKASLYIVENYIAQLKALGVYENATIIVMADHGDANPAFAQSFEAHGVLFVKQAQTEGAYTVSSAPVSYFDLHATLFDALGVDKGDTFFEIPLEERTRYFYQYLRQHGMVAVREFAITGDIGRGGQIALTGKVNQQDAQLRPYKLGTQLNFGLDCNALAYITTGSMDTEYLWLEGTQCGFRIPLENVPSGDLQVQMDIAAVYTPRQMQNVAVYANGVLCHVARYTEGGKYSFVIPREAFWQGSDLRLEFSLPDAISPEEVNNDPNGDERILSLAIRSLKIDACRDTFAPPAAYASGQLLTAQTLGGYRGSGWTAEGTMNSRLAVLYFDLGGVPTSDVTLDMQLDQPAEIYVNGQHMGTARPDAAGAARLTVPKSVAACPYLSLQLVQTGDGQPVTLQKLSISCDGVTPVQMPAEEFDLLAIISLPLTALLNLCYHLLGDYTLAIVVFTLLTKVILLPVSLWVQKNGITMVRLTPQLNRLKIKYYGDADTIAEKTQELYKQEKYNPLASTLPMIVQLVMLFGVIGAVKSALGDSQTVLTAQPSQIGGVAWLMPLAAGAAALLLGLGQNKLNPLQREQSKKEQWMSNGFSIAISLSLGAFVSLGVCVYWIASNLFSIAQQFLLNLLMNPAKYVDYEALEESRKELQSIENLSAGVSSEDKKREKEDYKRFFSVANKHLVIYSEKSGFYKYFRDVMDFMLEKSNVIIHYVTSDPKDQIFDIARKQPRIRPYYIGENKLITLFMKMDADMVVMTVPDLDRFHLKRSYVRKDIEYVYMFHYPLSTHMVLNAGALDHYDTVLCVGDFQFPEIRAAEGVYGTPTKKLISAGYGQLEQLHNSFMAMEKVRRPQKKILIAPSWQPDNILDSCIDGILEQLLDKGYQVVVRPHPEYVKRYKGRMDAIVARYAGRESSGLVFELDFTSNNSLFDSDMIISDWSGSAYEFSLVTLKPAVFVDTPMKVNNPEYEKLGVPPLEITLRDQVGIRVDPSQLSDLEQKVRQMMDAADSYAERILQIREKYIANFGRSGEVGGKYILEQLLARQAARKQEKEGAQREKESV